MNFKSIAILFFVVSPCIANAQLGNLVNKLKKKAEQKVEQRIENKADKAMNEALDEMEGKKTATTSSPVVKDDKLVTQSVPTENFTAYSKFDFVAGEKILYGEDFSQDAIGELPLNWNTSGKAAVVTLKDFTGNWLRMYQNSIYLTANKKEFPKDFTIEFDMILQFNYKSHTLPLVTVGILSSGDLETTDNALLQTPSVFKSAQLGLRPYANGSSSVSFKSFLNKKEYFTSGDQKMSSLQDYYNKVTHIAMQVQGSRLRIWINSEKAFDIPKALDTQYVFNQLFFKIHNSGYKEDEIGFFLSNIKVAAGLPDTRHKLIDEGQFSTNGILFEIESAAIKPESYGVIKEVAGVLKEHSSVRIKIEGHTSSDGNDASNMKLSERRAAAVKDVLVKDFGIEESRISTAGKGETEPVADNKTREGKLQNRRVAFIKL
ncbi:MAG TPA: OmpA family protein [Chitinophagaceae bacterium]